MNSRHSTTSVVEFDLISPSNCHFHIYGNRPPNTVAYNSKRREGEYFGHSYNQFHPPYGWHWLHWLAECGSLSPTNGFVAALGFASDTGRVLLLALREPFQLFVITLGSVCEPFDEQVLHFDALELG